MGFYIVDKQRIRVYSKWICATSLEEIAIHEYAHHIHETEKRRSTNRRLERIHGPEFWRIYFALCCKASLNGIYYDELIQILYNYSTMTFKELLNSVTFDKVAEYRIKNYHETEYSIG